MEEFEKHHLFEKEMALAEHELTPENRNENQIRLATDIYRQFNNEADPTSHDVRNDIMMFWVTEGYSKAYRDLEESEEFKFHPRLGGDILNITPDDVIRFKENGTIGE